MKIGFSLGQCIRDIVKGKVEYDEVVLILSGTLIKDEEQLMHVIASYLDRDNYLADCDEDESFEIAQRLWDDYKVIQPRMAKIYQTWRPFNSVWCDIVPSYNNNDNEAVKNAWESYRTVATLAGVEKI